MVSGGRHIGCSYKQLLVARDDICQFEISICNFINACYYFLLALVAEYEPEDNQHDDVAGTQIFQNHVYLLTV